MGISPEKLATLDLTTPASAPMAEDVPEETVTVTEADPKDVEVSIIIKD